MVLMGAGLSCSVTGLLATAGDGLLLAVLLVGAGLSCSITGVLETAGDGLLLAVFVGAGLGLGLTALFTASGLEPQVGK